MSAIGGVLFPPFQSFWRDEVATPARFNELRIEGRLEAQSCAAGTAFFYGPSRRSQRQMKAMNVKTERALARSAAPMGSRPEGSSHALMRIVPHAGPRDDGNDDIDDLGSSEATPPEASSALAQAEASEGAADRQHKT